MLHFGDKGKKVAAFATTETMPKAFVIVQMKGGCFFIMKWAEGAEVEPDFIQTDILAHNLGDIQSLLDFIDYCARHKLEF
ncbi:MAG: hypothetical protein A2117_02755 [Candidatus Wildermuthbacteria bacterium GWA2_46_15]|uniref:Uncharacterized protein n=1 Tax=Candidatus Wildermuthbacteria bacterium GWA2_46_15 TaxID=1802443 RepID=A0A1G2QMK3_9BACT|nr:MAG: hypothetical protein A2117_02755 [Candidatus Wildermuthbacteria bacterium GWA2_46_15]